MVGRFLSSENTGPEFSCTVVSAQTLVSWSPKQRNIFLSLKMPPTPSKRDLDLAQMRLSEERIHQLLLNEVFPVLFSTCPQQLQPLSQGIQHKAYFSITALGSMHIGMALFSNLDKMYPFRVRTMTGDSNSDLIGFHKPMGFSKWCY